jgi:hypothetical protein
MLAYDYPLLGMFWTILWIYLLVAWFVVLFMVIADVFRNDDMGGFSKALWFLGILFLPVLGVLIYLVSQGKGMAERKLNDAQARDAAMRAYVQDAAGSASTADQVAKLVELRDQGAITTEEFEAGKAKVFA